MQLRSLLSGAVAALLFCGAAQAASLGGTPPTPQGGLPGVFSAQKQAPVLMAQSTNQALDEQLRQMNGRIEELNFQIMQLQEQIRKMQEDNEFRFQELEDKKTDAGGAKAPRKHTMADPAPQPGAPSEPPATNTTAPADRPSIEELASAPSDAATPPANGAQNGEPEKSFGTITFDQSGNVVGGSVGDTTVGTRDPNAALPQEGTDTSDDTVVAALPPSNNPDDLYRSSYESILAGQYKTAEAGFRQHVERFPDDARAPDAQFWLGESLLGQQKYREAAEVFLAANKKFPKAKKAPDMLFKLGVSLVGINQRDVGCATFTEVSKRYPNASPALKKRIEREQVEAKC
ncbi:tol-pal system protein YbgF [Mesorhizobium denitrificans]|uniref:Cell division coordinator CpoB n=1 Tax=Mesorhizobium denitrificans TaxID=2294114 RepID=A0A371XF10_9HYPH|nr:MULTISPECIES: tol-pal system protein YbgF [Mesorhizobium]RFC67817.1 tol-pal system protein YbgF [Mesorhizobium denitrificans]